MACGNFNIQRFDLIIFFVWQYCLFGIVSDDLFPIFLNYEPDWRCRTTTNSTADGTTFTSRTSRWSTSCVVLQACNISADSVVEFHSEYFSAVQEWSMYCGIEAFYASLMTTIQCIGYIFGALVAGHASDHFGRKPVMIFFTLGSAVFGTSMSLAPNWYILAAIRFLMGFLCTGLLVVGNSYTNELVKTEQRFLLVVAFNWSNARILLTICCHLTRHWRSTSVIIHMLELPLVLLLLFLPESFIWLEEKGKTEEVIKVKNLIAKINGEELDVEDTIERKAHESPSPEDEEKATTSSDAQAAKVYTIKDLFSTKHLTVVTVILCFLHVTYALQAYMIDLNSSHLPGDFFLNQYILSISISLSKPIGIVIDSYSDNFNRRAFHQMPTLATALCFIVATLAMNYHISAVVIVAANLVGTIFNEFIWDALMLITVELYPTAIRSIGFGFCSIVSGFGSMVAPDVLFLRKLWEPAPFAAVAAVSLMGLFLSCIFLRDTKGKDLDSAEE